MHRPECTGSTSYGTRRNTADPGGNGSRVSDLGTREWRSLPTSDAAAFRATGAWSDVTLPDALRSRCTNDPDRTAIVDGDIALSFAALWDHAADFAQALGDLGVDAGDVVSMQLPNWHEAVSLVIAAAMIDAVINPIVPIYRDAEVGFILDDAAARVFAAPTVFRGFDYAQMTSRLSETGLFLGESLTVRGSARRARDRHVVASDPPSAVPRLDADAVRLLMYTSGTTGRAKGVMHSANTLGAELKAVIDYWSVTSQDVILMPSPLTHITGYLYGIELPVRTGAKTVLMDRWDPDRAIDLIEAHGVTLMVGATPFLIDLVDRAALRGNRLSSLRLFACGGAPVPPEVVYRALAVFERCVATRIYGSTEAPTVTLGVTSREDAKAAAETEGRVIGHEVRLIAADGHEVECGQEGEIVTRGPEVFLGYLNEEDERQAFTPDGFFRTGDLARFDPSGMLVVTGRKKDLIIRGGENISPKEIEDVLFKHPKIADVAVVAMPSARMGEAVCAFVIPREGILMTAEMLLEHVAASGLARQKWPERFVFTDALPKTAAGKIRKDLLRAQLNHAS
jgi:cyclohexanecarboxylate-CoA ligase